MGTLTCTDVTLLFLGDIRDSSLPFMVIAIKTDLSLCVLYFSSQNDCVCSVVVCFFQKEGSPDCMPHDKSLAVHR
jgi:hypothetical protein